MPDDSIPALSGYDDAALDQAFALLTADLERMLVDIGSPVRQGQVVARLTPIDFELKVRQADRFYDFYAKEALQFKDQQTPPELLPLGPCSLRRQARAIRAPRHLASRHRRQPQEV